MTVAAQDAKVVCEHIFGFSSAWDSLRYSSEEEMEAVRDGQADPEEYTYPYEAFVYCPLCGIKLER
jgi:hypothetical protein